MISQLSAHLCVRVFDSTVTPADVVAFNLTDIIFSRLSHIVIGNY